MWNRWWGPVLEICLLQAVRIKTIYCLRSMLMFKSPRPFYVLEHGEHLWWMPARVSPFIFFWVSILLYCHIVYYFQISWPLLTSFTYNSFSFSSGIYILFFSFLGDSRKKQNKTKKRSIKSVSKTKSVDFDCYYLIYLLTLWYLFILICIIMRFIEASSCLHKHTPLLLVLTQASFSPPSIKSLPPPYCDLLKHFKTNNPLTIFTFSLYLKFLCWHLNYAPLAINKHFILFVLCFESIIYPAIIVLSLYRKY